MILKSSELHILLTVEHSKHNKCLNYEVEPILNKK